MIYQRFFVVAVSCALWGTASLGCQMVCGKSADLILCDVEVDRFDVLLHFKGEKGRTSSSLSERLTCHIDEKDGRVVSCPVSPTPDEEKHQFRSTLRTVSETKLNPLTGEREESQTEYLDITMRSPKVRELPATFDKKDDVLKITFALTDCAAQTKQERETR